MIPDAAVEAAAEAIYGRRFGPKGWDGLPDKPRKQYAGDAREILEAAAPYMLAQVWDEGWQAAQDCTLAPNPYRQDSEN